MINIFPNTNQNIFLEEKNHFKKKSMTAQKFIWAVGTIPHATAFCAPRRSHFPQFRPQHESTIFWDTGTTFHPTRPGPARTRVGGMKEGGAAGAGSVLYGSAPVARAAQPSPPPLPPNSPPPFCALRFFRSIPLWLFSGFLLHGVGLRVALSGVARELRLEPRFQGFARGLQRSPKLQIRGRSSPARRGSCWSCRTRRFRPLLVRLAV